jgi:deoxycytidine triphosphate deaminase
MLPVSATALCQGSGSLARTTRIGELGLREAGWAGTATRPIPDQECNNGR